MNFLPTATEATPVDVSSSAFQYDKKTYSFSSSFEVLSLEAKEALQKNAPLRIVSEKTGTSIEFRFLCHRHGSQKYISTRKEIRGWAYVGQMPNGFYLQMKVMLD